MAALGSHGTSNPCCMNCDKVKYHGFPLRGFVVFILTVQIMDLEVGREKFAILVLSHLKRFIVFSDIWSAAVFVSCIGSLDRDEREMDFSPS